MRRDAAKDERAALAEQQAELDQEYRLLEIFRTEYDGRILVDHQANRQQALNLWNELQGLDKKVLGIEDDSLSAAWFAAVLKANPKAPDPSTLTDEHEHDARANNQNTKPSLGRHTFAKKQFGSQCTRGIAERRCRKHETDVGDR